MQIKKILAHMHSVGPSINLDFPYPIPGLIHIDKTGDGVVGRKFKIVPTSFGKAESGEMYADKNTIWSVLSPTADAGLQY